MAHDVFVSHSSKDKPTADAVCAVLESQGIRCWIAPRDIVPGKEWGASIIRAISGSKVMVLVFSNNANTSPSIRSEVERAVNKGIPIIPLRIENIMPGEALEFFLCIPHWLDAFTPPMEKHLQKLAKDVRQIISATAEEKLPIPPASAPPAKRKSKTKWIAAGMLVVLLAVLISAWPRLALVWYQQAAAEGNADAQYKLGKIYEDGKGVTQNQDMATDWYQKAAAGGSADAQYELGLMYDMQHSAQAITWYQKAAAGGNADAQNELGDRYENGDGVSQDYAQAAAWYQKAAPQGIPHAQINLGDLYYDGTGVPQDYAQALHWYQKAAAQGIPTAQNDIGVMYEYGKGVPQDYAQALHWYQKAAAENNQVLGSATAQYNLGEMYENGKGVAQDYAQAVEWYQIAGDEKAGNNPYAQFHLGLMYESGKGVTQDYAQAKMWLQKAANHGYKPAQDELLKLGNSN